MKKHVSQQRQRQKIYGAIFIALLGYTHNSYATPRIANGIEAVGKNDIVASDTAEAEAHSLEIQPGQDDGSSLIEPAPTTMPDAPDTNTSTNNGSIIDNPGPNQVASLPPSNNNMLELPNISHHTRLGTPTIPADIASLLPSGGNNIATGLNETPLNNQYAPTDNNNTCAQWIPEAESYYGIPQGILRSVNLVESGGYAWTLNVGGHAYYAQDMNDAIEHIANHNGQMRSDVAVGCMQLFTRYHADKFQDSKHMIDPRTNVMYAAYYLSKLHSMYHSWQEAVARYHSPTAKYQRTYLCEVVNRRIRLGFQHVNTWYQRTCSGSDAPKMGTKAIQIQNGY